MLGSEPSAMLGPSGIECPDATADLLLSDIESNEIECLPPSTSCQDDGPGSLPLPAIEARGAGGQAPEGGGEERAEVPVSGPKRRLSVILSCMAKGFRWLLASARMLVYTILLLPGFLRVVFFYFFSGRVTRHLLYGSQPRQTLDIYRPQPRDAILKLPGVLFPATQASSDADTENKMPPDETGGAEDKLPVVIFITGGAWIVGYKAWGALLSMRLIEHGALVVCLDYRNYPQADIEQMLCDVNTGISWVLQNIEQHGGDPANVVLVTQSAGGHLGLLALLKQAEQAATGCPTWGASPSWSPQALSGFVGVSGAFDLHGISENLSRRGLADNLLEKLMLVNGDPAMVDLSPLRLAQKVDPLAGILLPKVLLIHGTLDKSVPFEGSVQLQEALLAAGASDVSCRLIEGKTHTSFLLEDPMRGGQDLLTDLVLSAVTGIEERHHYKSICPGFLCSMAGWICPF